jgi:hypothetical protein
MSDRAHGHTKPTESQGSRSFAPHVMNSEKMPDRGRLRPGPKVVLEPTSPFYVKIMLPNQVIFW